MKNRTRELITALVIGVCLNCAGFASIGQKVNAIVNNPSQKKVIYSVHILKADTGEIIYSHNANMAVMPASNMKIITTAAALKYLGANYEYKTKIGLCGETLVVIGSGDPLLGDEITDAKYNRPDNWIFDDVGQKLKQQGINSIDKIIVDADVFDDELVHPNWPKEQLNQWYACEISGLNYAGNCIKMSVKNNAGRIDISAEPKSDYLKIINQVTPIAKGDEAVGAYRTAEKNKLLVKGKCRKEQGPFDVAIERPDLFFGSILAENISRQGITINSKLSDKMSGCDGSFREIGQYSTPLTDCLARANKNSLGLAAEALLKTIAAESQGGKQGSWAKGRELVSQYLVRLGIDSKEFYIDDGSGLSRGNRLSANAITKVFLDLYRSKDWALYKDSLAIGGTEGTISKYFKQEKYNSKIFGKTGYIAGVKAFSGVCCTSKGDYIFSILTNKANGLTRDSINNIAKAIIDETEPRTSR